MCSASSSGRRVIGSQPSRAARPAAAQHRRLGGARLELKALPVFCHLVGFETPVQQVEPRIRRPPAPGAIQRDPAPTPCTPPPSTPRQRSESAARPRVPAMRRSLHHRQGGPIGEDEHAHPQPNARRGTGQPSQRDERIHIAPARPVGVVRRNGDVARRHNMSFRHSKRRRNSLDRPSDPPIRAPKRRRSACGRPTPSA